MRLKSCKLSEHSHRLIGIKDRGGLWSVCENTISIFKTLEKIFRQSTVKFTTKILEPEITSKALKNLDIRGSFSQISQKVDVDFAKQIWQEKLLTKILQLYIRIRTHSFSKDIKKHKHKKAENKQQSLREQLKRATHEDKRTKK